MNSSDPIYDAIQQFMGGGFTTDKQGSGRGEDPSLYYCNKCDKVMQYITVSDEKYNLGASLTRKLLYCTNKNCDRYGLLTVVAVKK